ncbi:unnamed protein product [Euphydryas editha]|uniref:Dynein intermediate chain 3, ciliary n=1 Tax=Euphydryas editha TaxID=104508 RepID=A0AAU9V4Z2_EUPED|nr:unnamed protein product [Euphydryas editha]
MEAGLNYSYSKIRKNFGKQTRFCEIPTAMLDTISPDKNEQKLYCLRNPVNQESQTITTLSEHYVNTKRIVHRDQSVNHAEGGWPKDVNFRDEEATTRYRRRFEREDSYVSAILNLHQNLEHLIKQNNAIEMYNMYFKEMNSEKPVEKHFIRKINTFLDPEERPVSSIAWTYEDDSKIVVSYCNKKYPVTGTVNKYTTCLIWNVDNTSKVFSDFTPPSCCWKIAGSPTNANLIIGGLEDGRVSIFDIRAQKEPSAISPTHLAHRDPVSALLFITSRLNNEFFSGSSDGRCMWWDIRNLSEPIDSLLITTRVPSGPYLDLTNIEGISALQFDRSFPTRFLCGTDTGFVINVNRKGKSYQEVLSAIFPAHKGYVKSVQRNPSISKMFLTCGDWTSHIWSDDIHSSPIIFGTAHPKQISDAAWSPQRVSSYMTICMDGKFRYWDLLRKYYEPVAILPISKYPLLNMKANDEGKFIAIGDTRGSLHLIYLSDSMVFSGDRDKQLMIQNFDRETRREHILETRIKEIRLKQKLDTQMIDYLRSETGNEENLTKNAEDEYRRVVADEFKKVGTTQSSRGRNEKLRNR